MCSELHNLNSYKFIQSMKDLNTYITEKLVLNKSNSKHVYNYHPKDKDELEDLLKKLLEERGEDADLNDIDTSAITDMTALFYSLDPYNINISDLDVSNVEDMKGMFYECRNFNCDLSSWDVSNVEDMDKMFYGCMKFKGEGLDDWEVDNVMSMRHMFDRCKCKKPEWY